MCGWICSGVDQFTSVTCSNPCLSWATRETITWTNLKFQQTVKMGYLACRVTVGCRVIMATNHFLNWPKVWYRNRIPDATFAFLNISSQRVFIHCAYWFTTKGAMLVWSALKCLTSSGHVGPPALNRMAFCTTTVRFCVCTLYPSTIESPFNGAGVLNTLEAG